MTAIGRVFADAAAGLVGAPFRLHGRDPVSGVDCVGLVAVALTRCGRPAQAPEGYCPRARDLSPWFGFAERNAFRSSDPKGQCEAGDLLLLRVSPIQPHLAVSLGSGGFVHAHAGLRRVVIERGEAPWPVAARWRLHDRI